MLDAQTFKTVIENTPLVSIDLCLVCDGQVLLGKRTNDPLKGECLPQADESIKMKPGNMHCLE